MGISPLHGSHPAVPFASGATSSHGLYGIVFVLLLVVSAVSLIVYIYKSKIGIYVSIACLVIIFAYGIIMKDSPLQLIIIFLPVIYAMFSTRE